jgi:hypothetical protein
MNTYSVNMSVEQTLLVRISKDDISNEEQAKEKAESLVKDCDGMTISNSKLKKIQDSLSNDDTVVQVINIEDGKDHYKVAVNYLESFYFDMKGTESTIDKRAEAIISTNGTVSHNTEAEIQVLSTEFNCLTASELEKEDIEMALM